jgi:hypothetical protein
MSKEVKIVLIVIGSLAALVFVAFVGAIAYFGVTLSHQVGASDPASKARTAAKIASFTLPAGYHYAMAMDMGVMNLVAIAPENSESKFLIELQGIALPVGGETDDQLMKSLQQSLGTSTRCNGMTTVGDDPVKTASGKTIVLREMTCKAGSLSDSAVEFGHIPSSYPLAIIMAIGSQKTFDHKAVHELVGSLR